MTKVGKRNCWNGVQLKNSTYIHFETGMYSMPKICRKREIMIKKLSLGIMLLFAFSTIFGCANIQDDSDRTRAEGATTGAVVGGILGALVGQALGGDTGSTLAGAAIGAAVGGASGYAYGDHVAGQKEQYANSEDWLNACIADARQTNENIIIYNFSLEKQIAALQRDTDVLKQQYADAAINRATLQAKKQDVDVLLESANNELTEAKTELEVLSSVVTDANQSGQGDYAEPLSNEIENLKASIRELERSTEELASMSASMAV